MYGTREFAGLAGITVRTLHHYDRLGLLKPKRRTGAGYRLYDLGDLEQLERITALKFLGISLAGIGTLLRGRPLELVDSLRVQRKLLEEKRRRIDLAIQAIDSAELAVQNQGSERASVLKTLIEAIEMQNENDNEWLAKYATEAGAAKMEARKGLWSPELQERVSRQWNELIADVEASLTEDALSEKAQALAARWNALVEEFTGRDKDIGESVSNAWADRADWPARIDARAPKISPEAWSFIARANQARSRLG